MRLGPDLTWLPLEPDTPEFVRMDEALFALYPPADNPQRRASIGYEVAPLPSHPDAMIVRVIVRSGQAGPWPVYGFFGDGFHCYVTGRPEDVYALNLWVPPALASQADISAYLRLWLEVARGQDGWRLVETPEDLAWTKQPTAEERQAAIDLIHPMEISDPNGHGARKVRALVQNAGSIDVLHLIFWPDGLVQAKEGGTIYFDPSLATPEPLLPFSGLRGTILAMQAAPQATGGALQLEGMITGKPLDIDVKQPATPKPDIMDALNVTPPGATQPEWNLSAVFEQLAGILLTRALQEGFPAARGSDPQKAFFKYLNEFRPTILIETPYRELRGEFARFIADGCGLALNLKWENGSNATNVHNPMTLSDQPGVVLLTEATFARNLDGSEPDAGQLLTPIIRGPHVALMVAERVDALPQDARDMIDLSLKVPRMNDSVFWSCTASLFSKSKAKSKRRRAADWIRYVLPRDMARIAAATRDHGRYLAELEATIRRRLGQYTAPDAPSLKELQGLGEARYRVEELADDIRSALGGTIGWHQVDRGYLLVGPPGTGKTTLVRALAKDCGIRFILASAARWQEQSSLGPHIQSIRRTFREARLYAPAILFIDEIDSLGSRNRTEAHNSQYQTVVINTVLEELQGFEDREGVIVIGATNNPENVDEALRRPGRLDRIVQVPYPNVAALAAIYGFYLARAARDGVGVGTIDLQRLAQLTFGRTGSHVELYVRGATRRVRRDGRTSITELDVVAEITARPPEGFGHVLSPETMRRTAVHEAGHALVAMTGPDQDRDIPMVSITPRADGSLGFVARAPQDSGVMTRGGMEDAIRVMLGGRAAEEMVFGQRHISGGAGGSGESDLAHATHAVLWLLTEFGFSEAGGLLWIDWRGRGPQSQLTADAIRTLPMGEAILHEARTTIDRLYAETLERLYSHRGAHERIVTALIERQELSSQEVRAAIAQPT